MSDEQWLETWRAWLRARFGDRLDDAQVEAAAAECESLRGIWGPVLEREEDNGELPFPNPLPAGDGPDAL